MSKKYYLTTPIYYVNAAPHIGHAYTTIAADAIRRLKRMQGYDAILTTGTDEHGQKVERAAKATGKTPQEFTDLISAEFRQQWETLGLAIDRFKRTSSPDHYKVVQDLFLRCQKNGYIEKGSYTGQYCVSDELYVNEAGPGDPCPDCGRPTETVTEENYFFKLSAFRDRLLEFYAANPGFIRPETRRNEVLAFVERGLSDLSISRTTIKWGIPVPAEGKHVFYVWFDALTTYMSAVAGENRWPADLHLIGKEILRFHAIYWPAFLMAADLPLPKQIFAHGWLLFEQDKMSKSRGNIVRATPIQQVVGTDGLRYFLLREIVFGQDGNFSFEALVNRYNSDLANGLGNLASRTLTMIRQYREGAAPASEGNREIAAQAQQTIAGAVQAFDNLEFSKGIEAIWALLASTDKYIVEQAPWTLAAKADDGFPREARRDPVHRRRSAADCLYPAGSRDPRLRRQNLGTTRHGRAVGNRSTGRGAVGSIAARPEDRRRGRRFPAARCEGVHLQDACARGRGDLQAVSVVGQGRSPGRAGRRWQCHLHRRIRQSGDARGPGAGSGTRQGIRQAAAHAGGVGRGRAAQHRGGHRGSLHGRGDGRAQGGYRSEPAAAQAAGRPVERHGSRGEPRGRTAGAGQRLRRRASRHQAAMSLVDSHCHLDDPQFEADRAAVIERAIRAGVTCLVAVGTGGGPPDLEAGIRLADAHECVMATVGVHPHDACKADAGTWRKMEPLLAHSRVIAVGEIGLDYHYDHSPRDQQRAAFVEQMRLARQAHKPIVIHTREAWEDTWRLLEEHWVPAGLGGILHCFSGGPEEARRALDMGFHLAFGGVITFPKATNVREAAVSTPLDRLLIETDAPYLAPVPMRGKRNEPAFVVETARKLAALRGRDLRSAGGGHHAELRKALFARADRQRVN